MVSVQGVSSTELLVTPRLPIKPGAILLLSRALDGYGDSVQLLPPELLSGQTFKGELPDNNDIDQFTLTVLRESQLNLTLEYDWQSGFRPHLALLGPSGEFALSSFPGQYFQSQYVRSRNGGRKIEIRDFPLSLSGRWTVMVGMPIPGVGGDYQTQLEIAAPAYSELRFRASNALQVASSGTAIAFEALKDSRLNGVLQIRRAPGARINVDSLMGPHGDIAPSLRTSGALSQSIDGRTITFNDARISRIGLYELTLTSSANAGQVVEVRGDLSIGVPQGSGEIRDFDE